MKYCKFQALALALTLISCNPQSVLEQGEVMKDQAGDLIEMGKETIEDVKERIDEVQEGVDLIKEGTEKIRGSE